MSYAQIVRPRAANTSVFQPLPRREDEMIKNAHGAYVFEISKWNSALRWLILGAASGTFYASKQKITVENAKNLESCMADEREGLRLVKLITDVSLSGRAASNTPAIFALALCATSGKSITRAAAIDALPKVCRYATDLYAFVDAALTLNGHRWNRSLRRAVANWYNKRAADKVAYQVVKYGSRTVTEGDALSRWSHKDLLALSHPTPATEEHSKIYGYAVDKVAAKETGNGLIEAVSELRSLASKRLTAADEARIVSLIERYDIPHEAIPNEFKNNKWLWEALIPNMPVGALIRNLPKATSVGAIEQTGETGRLAALRLTDVEQLKYARIHPIGILKAMMAYRQGYNRNMRWTPVRRIVDALDQAFYLSFQFVEKIEDEVLLGWDTSGSMHSQRVLGIDTLTATQAAGAMVMATLAGATNARTFMFNNKIKESDVSPRQRLDDAVNAARAFGGSTNLALPIQHAIDNKIKVKAFVIFTDNETNMYTKHPVEVLKEYRRVMNVPDAKLIVVALTGTKGSIADPKDANCLDVVGLDTSTPKVINAFIKGELSRETLEANGNIETASDDESESD